jgi:hypothetical protein
MIFAFDLISDLHVESWKTFDWTDQATSPYCIVAGDVARDRQRLLDTLTHLGKCYPGGVFYVDGNEEHKDYMDNLGASYRDLAKDISSIPNVVYLQDNVIIINGVAILGTNGWWTYDFDTQMDLESSIQAIQDHNGITNSAARNITGVAYNDANYMINSIRTLQTHNEVASIVVVSHTVPAPWIIDHDLELVGNWRVNGMGNSQLTRLLNQDTENKIKSWCFGHYHRSVNQVFNGIEYRSNPRGRGDTPWSQTAYYPQRIEIKI